MCGISAILSPFSIDSVWLYKMNDMVSHRGPDDEGFVFVWPDFKKLEIAGGKDTPEIVYNSHYPYIPNRNLKELSGTFIGLGHRRLSILDVSPAGHQPMCTSDRSCWIVYNGEVYNYIELRNELEALGYKFFSQTDTEVILAAWREWGRKCLHRLNGMFAFILLDLNHRVLFAARDRFGVKPLYYWTNSNSLIAFASELKQFAVLPGLKPSMNGQRVYDFLVWGITDHTNETMFSDVFQFRPGEALELRLDEVLEESFGYGKKLPIYRWYELKAAPFDGNLEEAANNFRQLLSDSVHLRLRSDVPVGSCLSGGLDSSSIVCIMNRLLREKDAQAHQKTFSACSDIKRFDEKNWVQEVVKDRGITAHYICPSLNDLFSISPHITWHQDEPFGSTSIYAQWNVFKLASVNHVKVMLDGQGSDEQLAGYHSFFGPKLTGLFKSLQWISLWQEIKALRHLHGYSFDFAVKCIANNMLPEFFRHLLIKLVGERHIAPPWLDLERLGAEPRDPFFEAGAKTDTIRNLSYAQLTSSNLQMLLHWEDRNSMAHSIESRVPFLDYRLVEFVLGLPDEFKLTEGITKRVLRIAMDGILPDRVRDRIDKLGFVTPEEVWLRETAPELFRKKLEEAIEASDKILRADCNYILEETIAGRKKFNFLPWRLINFGEWLKIWNVRVK